MNKMRKQFLILMCGLLLATQCANAQEAGPTEYQIKAAFLFNFAKFVEWPPKVLGGASTPLVIGILGGFTTFSTFSYETITLLREGVYLQGLMNATASLLGCLIATFVAVAIARKI